MFVTFSKEPAMFVAFKVLIDANGSVNGTHDVDERSGRNSGRLKTFVTAPTPAAAPSAARAAAALARPVVVHPAVATASGPGRFGLASSCPTVWALPKARE